MRSVLRRTSVFVTALLISACTGAEEPDNEVTDITAEDSETENLDSDEGSEDGLEDGAEESGPEDDEGSESEDAEAEEPVGDVDGGAGAEAQEGAEEETDEDASADSDDPFAVPDDPDDIDAEYVDAVMNELLAVDSEILSEVLQDEPDGSPPEEELEALRAILSGPRLISSGQELTRYATSEEMRVGLLDTAEVGSAGWETRQIVHADSQCILAIGYYDITEIATEPFSEELGFAAVLDRGLPDDLPADIADKNSTGWRHHDMGSLESGNEVIAEKDWDNVAYSEALDIPCESYDGA